MYLIRSIHEFNFSDSSMFKNTVKKIIYLFFIKKNYLFIVESMNSKLETSRNKTDRPLVSN